MDISFSPKTVYADFLRTSNRFHLDGERPTTLLASVVVHHPSSQDVHRSGQGEGAMNSHDRTEEIRVRAYYRSLQRAPYNDPLMDWLEAEADQLAAEQDIINNEAYLGPARSHVHARSGIAHSDGRDHENPT